MVPGSWWGAAGPPSAAGRAMFPEEMAMVPNHRTLAELALKRQEELSRQLAGKQWSSSSSLLPNVLRRCIVTISVCHETLRSLQAAAENGPRVLDGRPR